MDSSVWPADFNAMTNMGKGLRENSVNWPKFLPEVCMENISKDGTRKWVMKVDGGSAIETVFIPEKRPWHALRQLANWLLA